MRFRRQCALVAAASASLALGFAGPAAADPGSGSAYGVQASVLGGVISIPPIPLVVTPPGGQKSLLNVGAGGINVAALSVSSQGSNGNVTSSAGLLGATVPGFVTASAVTSQCASTPTSATGSSQLLGASTPAGPIAANPPPNTTIPAVIGTLALNEQQTTSNSIRVRAVHAAASPVADVILAESDCGVVLVGAANALAARATAGGSVPSLAG